MKKRIVAANRNALHFLERSHPMKLPVAAFLCENLTCGNQRLMEETLVLLAKNGQQLRYDAELENLLYYGAALSNDAFWEHYVIALSKMAVTDRSLALAKDMMRDADRRIRFHAIFYTGISARIDSEAVLSAEKSALHRLRKLLQKRRMSMCVEFSVIWERKQDIWNMRRS